MQWSMAVVLLLTISLFAAFSLPLGGGPGKMTLADVLDTYRSRDRINNDRELMERSYDLHRDTLTRLIEGRLSLAEATATLYQDIEGLPPRLCPKLPHSFHARDEESRMRMTVEWAEIFLENHPYRDEIRERLHKELQAFREAKIRSTPQPSEGRPSGSCRLPMKVAKSAQE
jgi:hypothetical protein